jgi:decaprenyl-phosphate phosphoribosyltransferase
VMHDRVLLVLGALWVLTVGVGVFSA